MALAPPPAPHQANGARLGWLLLPHERAVEIWRGGQPGMAERLENVAEPPSAPPWLVDAVHASL
jgi:hypothetical protein